MKKKWTFKIQLLVCILFFLSAAQCTRAPSTGKTETLIALNFALLGDGAFSVDIERNNQPRLKCDQDTIKNCEIKVPINEQITFYFKSEPYSHILSIEGANCNKDWTQCSIKTTQDTLIKILTDREKTLFTLNRFIAGQAEASASLNENTCETHCPYQVNAGEKLKINIKNKNKHRLIVRDETKKEYHALCQDVSECEILIDMANQPRTLDIYFLGPQCNKNGVCEISFPFASEGIKKLVASKNGNGLWALTNENYVLKTNKDGQSWMARADLGNTEFIFGFFALTEQQAFLTGSNASIFHTQDGGYTWKKTLAPTTGIIAAVSGVDNQHIWAVGENGVILFFNGQSWVPQNSPVTHTLYAVFATDTKHVWAAGEQGTLIFFDGQNWNTPIATNTKLPLYDLWVSPSNTVYTGGDNGTLLKCINNNTCSQAMNIPNKQVTSIWGTQDNNIWAVAENFTLHFDGNNWSATEIGITARSVVGMLTEQLWIAGSTGSNQIQIIHQSTSTELDPLKLSCVFPINGFSNGWVNKESFDLWLSSTCAIGRYDNNQNTWTPVSVPLTYETKYIQGNTDNRLIAVGENGQVLSFKNNKYTVQTSNITNRLFAIDIINANIMLATGLGKTIRTKDNATTWETVNDLDGYNLFSITHQDDQVWVVGNGGKIFYSQDAGAHFSLQNSLVNSDFSFVWALDSQHVFAVGQNGVILYTKDAGKNWVLQDDPNNLNFKNINFYGIVGTNSNEPIYAVGVMGEIYRFKNNQWSFIDTIQTLPGEPVLSITTAPHAPIYLTGHHKKKLTLLIE